MLIDGDWIYNSKITDHSVCSRFKSYLDYSQNKMFFKNLKNMHLHVIISYEVVW